MGVVDGRTTDSLAGVVDDHVQSVPFALQIRAEQLESGDVAEIKSVNMQLVLPDRVVRFFGEANDGIIGESCGGDNRCSTAKQLECTAKADFDASAGHQTDLSRHIDQFVSLFVVEIRAFGA